MILQAHSLISIAESSKEKAVLYNQTLFKPIALLFNEIFQKIKSIRGLALPASLPNTVRSAIVHAPIIANNLWNLDANQIKCLSDCYPNFKRSQPFRGRPRRGRGFRYPRFSGQRGSHKSTKETKNQQ